jgi:hypothetical protein
MDVLASNALERELTYIVRQIVMLFLTLALLIRQLNWTKGTMLKEFPFGIQTATFRSLPPPALQFFSGHMTSQHGNAVHMEWKISTTTWGSSSR